MALTDILIPLTAKKIGPLAVPLVRPRVFYLRSSDLIKVEPDSNRDGSVLTVSSRFRKVEVYENPNEFMAAQGLSQAGTGTFYSALFYTATGATGNTPALAQPLTNYFNNINSGAGLLGVALPDPFVRRKVVILNTSTGPITVFGRNATAYINGATAGVVVPVGKRLHFIAPTQGTASSAGQVNQWKTAIDA